MSPELEEALFGLALAADLEYKLQAAVKINCECSTYLILNRERLLPNMMEAALDQRRSVHEVISNFVAGLHQRHLSGKDIFA